VLAADHDQLIRVADAAAHTRVPAVGHLSGFGSRSNAEAGTSSLSLLEEPITQIGIVFDVEAQEDSDAVRSAGRAQIVPRERRAAVCIDSVWRTPHCASRKASVGGLTEKRIDTT